MWKPEGWQHYRNRKELFLCHKLLGMSAMSHGLYETPFLSGQRDKVTHKEHALPVQEGCRDQSGFGAEC